MPKKFVLEEIKKTKTKAVYPADSRKMATVFISSPRTLVMFLIEKMRDSEDESFHSSFITRACNMRLICKLFFFDMFSVRIVTAEKSLYINHDYLVTSTIPARICRPFFFFKKKTVLCRLSWKVIISLRKSLNSKVLQFFQSKIISSLQIRLNWLSWSLFDLQDLICSANWFDKTQYSSPFKEKKKQKHCRNIDGQWWNWN